MLIQLSFLNHCLLPLRHGSKSPSPRVRISLHNHSLNLGNNPMITSRHNRCCHLRNCNSNCLSLGSHEHHLRAHINIIRKPQKTRNHQLGPITNGIDSRILHHNPLVIRQQDLKRHNNPSQVLLILCRIIHMLCIQDIMHGTHIIILAQNTRSDPPQLLHMSPGPNQETKVHAKSTNIRSCFTVHPKNTKITLLVKFNQFRFINGTNTKLTLDRRDQGRSLK
mmetsp:Transcript_15791/g.23555  ORF Transcript_15791/g.23555 Transcript_15791/m.23555 type:complete len:222 (+) Transcript_15791:422-1087(+)